MTRDRGERPNAYALNDEPQFGRPAAGPNPPPEAAAPSVPCRVKLLGNWASPRELCAAFERQAKEGRRWDGIAITDQDDADLFALFNLPGPEAGRFDPARTVVFAMEPDHAVARWGEWAAPDPRVFLQVRHHDRFPNCGEWHLGMTWGELRAAPVGPKTRGLSAVVSSRVADPGQLLRIGFLKFLEERGFPVDVWGWDNAHGFRGYRGSLPPRDKRDGLLPYRYTLAVENSAHPNYFTEKVLDALLAECLPFTRGCPNLADHLDPRAFVPLPLEDPEESLRMVTRTIAEETWSRRVDDIRREKRRILDEAHLFPTLARIARGDRLARALEIRVVNLDRRPDRLASFRREVEERAGSSFAARVVRFPAVDGRSLALTPELRHLFRGNDFGFRRGFVGCALSHLALWREAASSPAPAFLILEDDARLRRGFTGELVELCGALEERHPDFDAVLLGFFRWSEGAPSLDEPDHRTVRPVAFDGSRYLGGTFGYLLSRKGAARLVDLVERDGIQNGIDRFVHLKETELTILVAEPDLAAAHLVPPGSGLDSDIQNDPEPVPG